MKNPSFFYKIGSDICKAPTNTSTAKYRYSFPKAERFKGDNKKQEDREREKEELKRQREEDKKKEEKNIYIKHDYYLLPSTLSKRSTNFDYFPKDEKMEKKRKLAQSQRVEPKDKSSKESKPEDKLKKLYEFAEYEYERKYFHGPSYTIPKFGKEDNKKKKKKGENEEDKESKEKTEDKTKTKQEYKEYKPFGSEAPKYSIKGIPDPEILKMRERIKEKIAALDKEKREKLFEKLHIKEPPIPEVTVKITKSGKYAPSQIPNVNSVRIEKPFKVRDEQRHKLEINNNTEAKEREQELEKKINEFIEKEIIRDPAGDEKKLKAMLFSLMGENYPSKYRSNGKITMAKRYKVKDSRENYPGPGSYLLPSDFGIYRSPNAPAYPEENVYPVEKIPFEEAAWRHGMKKIEPIEEEDKNKEDDIKNDDNKTDDNKTDDNKTDDNKIDVNNQDNHEDQPEDKESELEMLRDILVYPKENEEENKEEKEQLKAQQKEQQQKEQQQKEQQLKEQQQKEQQQKEQQLKEQQLKEQQQKEQQLKEQQQKEQQQKEQQKKEEDKESECIMLRDVLVYPK